MVMPLSRYVAGDFVTPQMELAWQLGSPYKQIGPNGVRDFPQGVPYGGPDAAERRADVAREVREQLAPLFDPLPWDEGSQAAPRFHRTDPVALEAFRDHLTAPYKPTLLDRLLRRSRAPAGLAHVFGTIFVPASVAELTQIERPLPGIIASIGTALAFLDAPCPPEAEYARDTLREALVDAQALGLPMIVDA